MMLLLVTMQLIFILQRSLTSSSLFSNSDNGVKIDNYYYLVGEDLRLNCTLSNDLLETWKSDSLYFEKIDQANANGNQSCLNKDLKTIVDDSTAALTIKNVSVDSENVYFCYAGNCSNCKECSETVGFTEEEIKIQYGPKNVTDVSCFIYNWNDHMNCSWKHPVKYQDYNDTFVSISENSTLLYQGELLETCSWPRDKFIVKNKYSVNITVYNIIRNLAASQIILIERNENVKPAPVTHLIVVELPSGCLLLSWNHTSSEDKVFKVLFQEAQLGFKVMTSNLNQLSYQECNTKPYTLYTFSVSCFPSGAKGYWSDSTFVNITTKILVPKVGPKVTNSSYVTFDCFNNSKDIYIYWQRPDNITKINNYLIKKDDKILKNETADNYTGTFQLDCNSRNVLLNILAENAQGQSIKSSSMLILQNFTVPAKVKETFSVEWNESLRAVWDHDNSKKTSYMLYWCEGSSSLCKNQIDWAVVSSSDTNYSLPILDDDPTKYLYGISVHNDVNSSDIYWTNCLFKLNPPEIPAPSVKITPSDNSAIIIYKMEKCSYHNPIKITSFLIQYSEELLWNDTKNIMHTAADTFEVSLSLKPATSYKISVQGKVNDKLGELTVKTFITRSENLAESTWIIAAVLIPSLGCIIILVVACFVRKCHKSRLKTAFYIDNIDSRNANLVTGSGHLFPIKDSVVIKTPSFEPDTTSSPQYASSQSLNNASETYIKMSYLNENAQHSDQSHQNDTESFVLRDLPNSIASTENNIPVYSNQTTVDPQLPQDKQGQQFVMKENIEIYPIYADQSDEINKDKPTFTLETSPCNDYVHQIH